MKVTQRTLALFRGSLMYPAAASFLAARLTRSWLLRRGQRHAWTARKFSILQRAIAARNIYDVIVWDEGALALCASMLYRDPSFQYAQLVTDMLENGYDEHCLFVSVGGDIETLIRRQELRYPVNARSAPLTERIDRLKRAEEFWQFVCESLNRIYYGKLLWLNAAQPAALNADLTLQFINYHQHNSITSEA
jgi:hypothetical protein